MSGSTTSPPQANTTTTEEQALDALIPPPLSPLRKLLVSATLLGLALAVTYASFEGLLYPRPFANSSFSGDQALVLDPERNAVGAFVWVPNGSGRAVRITEVTFDAPGAELVDVTFAADNNAPATDSVALPATIASDDRDRGIWVWFRPTSCEDVDERWGFAEVTFDFGDGAFPPFSATHRIDSDPVQEFFEDDVSLLLPTNQFIDGPGPLALACEVTQ